jgi:hypothetical protein
LLFNLGQCHRQLHDYPAAAVDFEQYLRERPSGSNGKVVRELLADVRRRLAAREEVSRLAGPAPAMRPSYLPGPPPRTGVRGRHEGRTGPPPFYRRRWFWTAVAGVVAVSVTAGLSAGSSTTVPPAGTLGTVDRR